MAIKSQYIKLCNDTYTKMLDNTIDITDKTNLMLELISVTKFLNSCKYDVNFIYKYFNMAFSAYIKERKQNDL